MIQVIYGDVLLIIDFCMNFFVLNTSAIILRRKIKPICIIGASFVGGIYSVVKLFVFGNSVVDCIISILVGILVCYIGFGGKSFLKTLTVFFCFSALIGGIMMGCYFLLGSYHYDLFGNLYTHSISHMPLWLFVVLAAISFLISWLFSFVGRENIDEREVNVYAKYCGRSIIVRLLLDSGNLAKEPISGKYVILMSKQKGRKLIGDEMYSAIVNNDSEKLLKKRFRLIGATDFTGARHTYYAFLPDELHLSTEAEELDAYIAICLSDAIFENYDGIVHPSVFA